VLLNILVALFNQAYSNVMDNAVDEFLALFSLKTLKYVRPPDENPYCPPLNLIEIFFMVPLEPVLNRAAYARVNQVIMTIIYFPFLVIIAIYESKLSPRDGAKCRFQARRIAANRIAGLEIDQHSLGWDIEEEFDAVASGWTARVEESIPQIQEDEMVFLRKISTKLDWIKARFEPGRRTSGASTGGPTGGSGGVAEGEQVNNEGDRNNIGPPRTAIPMTRSIDE